MTHHNKRYLCWPGLFWDIGPNSLLNIKKIYIFKHSSSIFKSLVSLESLFNCLLNKTITIMKTKNFIGIHFLIILFQLIFLHISGPKYILMTKYIQFWTMSLITSPCKVPYINHITNIQMDLFYLHKGIIKNWNEWQICLTQ